MTDTTAAPAPGDELPLAPICSSCAGNEDGRCCGTGECWLCPLSQDTTRGRPFQQRVEPWMLSCFGAAVSRDRAERSHRFLEEALELVQAAGCSASEAHQLVDYVFGRPVGELQQEVGGVMVTLAALCLAQDVNMHAAGDTELARVWTKIDVIRAKHAAKPKHSPLPGASVTETATGPRWWHAKMLAAAASTGDAGTIQLAAQLADCLPCPVCDFVKTACRCGRPSIAATPMPAEPDRLLAPQPAPARNVVPGKVQCAKCGFSLQRVNLYMLSGTTGAGGEETEPCPNDGTPLLPVTWEQEAREAWKMAEQQLDRAHALEAAGAELVACKDLKDEESRLRQRRDVAISRDREATGAVDAMRNDYNRRKPLAWAAMRALLPTTAGRG